MKRDLEGSDRAHNLSRLHVIGLIGATAAASLVGAAGEPSASAERSGTPTQNGQGRMAEIDAKPAPVTIDIAKTAVIVVDMQNDFGSRGGMFDRAGIDISMIQGAVAPTARAISGARKAGIKIIYLKMALQPDLSDLRMRDSPNWRVHQQIMHVGTTVRAPNGSESRILVRDTWNTDIVG